MSTPIAILGAGPSGLTLGRLLHLANIDFIIFERDQSRSETATGQGGTLDVRADSGQIALQAAGLLDRFKAIARYDAGLRIADKDGKVYIDVDGTDGDSDKPEIDRKDLRDLLLDSIPAEKIRWGCQVTEVQRADDGSMSVHFKNGPAACGLRLVVGADGAWSKAQSLVTQSKPDYTGVYYMTTSISSENSAFASTTSLAGTGLYMAFGEEKQLLAIKLGDGSYQIGLGLRLPEAWRSDNPNLANDPKALRDWLLQRVFAKWPQVHTDLIRHSEGGFRIWPLYGMPVESLTWNSVPGVALVGDAAHLIPPFAGEGVNCALYDSLQLAQQIVKHGLDNLTEAVAEYESLMLPRGIELIEKSNKSGELIYAADAPKGWLKAMAGMDID